MAKKGRLDAVLHERGIFPSREKAKAAIMAGVVSVDGILSLKAGAPTAFDAEIAVSRPVCPYVSRGGLKLAAAFDAFSISPQGLTVIDIGASTGGFTDC